MEVKIDWDGLGDRAVPLPWGTSNYQNIVGLKNGVLAFSNGTLLKFDLGSREASTILTGLAVDVANSGALLIQDDQGRLHSVHAGDVSLRPAP